MPTVESVSLRGAIAEAVLVHQHAQGRDGRLVVEQRLPHPHHDHVPRKGVLAAAVRVGLGDGVLGHHGRYLAQDLGRLEVALIAGDAGEAERALQRTAGLGRDADRAPVCVGDVHGLDRGAAFQPEQVLARAVLRERPLGDLGPDELEVGLERLAKGLRQVLHRRDLPNAALVEPAVELPAAERGLAPLRGEPQQGVLAHAEQIAAAHPTIIPRAHRRGPCGRGVGSRPRERGDTRWPTLLLRSTCPPCSGRARLSPSTGRRTPPAPTCARARPSSSLPARGRPCPRACAWRSRGDTSGSSGRAAASPSATASTRSPA